MNIGMGTKTPHILLLEDDRAHLDLILRSFRDDPDPFRVSVAENLLKARQLIEQDPPDLILADWILPDGKGLDLLTRKDGSVTTPLVIMTSFGDEHLAVEIMKSGAIDYVVKSASMFAELPHIARKALRDWENIHERKRAEEAVQDTQKRLADILGFLPDAVFAIDNDGRVIAWNNAIERMTGIPAEAMLGKGDHEYSLPFYGERRPILIDLVFIDDTAIEKKYDYIQRDGDRITTETFIPSLFGGKGAYLWGTATPLYDRAGNRTGAIEVIRNITERKQNEELLRQREATLETLLNAPKDIILLLDRKQNIIDINQEGARRLGGTVQELTGRCSLDLLPPDLAHARKRNLDQVFESGEAARFDDERSGAYFHNEVYPIFNPEHSAVEHIAIFARDITDQKRAEEALQESETRFKDLFNNILAGVAIYRATPDGEDFIIRDVNRAVEMIEQVRKDDIVGRRLLEVFPGVAEFGLLAVFQRVAQTGIPESHPVSLYSDNRISGWRENYVYRLPSGEVVAVYEDVTEKKQAEKAERETRRKYAELFELGSEAIFLIENETGAILEANTAACEMYGYSRDLLLTLKNTDLSAEQEETHKVTVGTAQGTILIPLRYHRRNDGTVFPVEILGRFFVWKNRPVHIAAIRDITTRIEAEDALRESEAKFHAMVDASPDMIWEIDLQGNFSYISSQSHAQLGYSHEALIGKPFFTLIEPESIPAIKAIFLDHVREKSSSSTLEVPAKRSDGSPCIIEIRSVPTTGKNGQLTGFMGIARDITERRKAEHSLLESELRYRSVVENASEGIAIAQDAQLQYVNPRLLEMIGARPEEILGHPFTDFIHPDDRGLVLERYQRRISGEDVPQNYDFRILGKNKEITWVQLSAVRIEWNKKPATLNFITDISERKQMEETLQKSEQEFRSLAESMPQIVWATRADGWNIYFNQQWVDYTGLSLEESYGHGWNIPFHPDDRQRAWDAWERATQHHDTYSLECRLRRADGAYRWWLIRGVPVRNAGGEIIKWFGTCTDIESIKQTEDKLRESEERYLSLFNRSLDCIYIHDLAGHFIDANASALELLGYSRDEISSVSFQDLLGPDDLGKAKAAVETIAREGSHSGLIEYRLKRKDGSFAEIETKGTLIVHDDKPYAVFGIARDITFRKQAEELRKAYEERLGSAMEIGSLAWWEMDLPGGEIRFDDRKATMLGYSPQKFRHYTDFTSILHPDDIEPTMHAMKDHLEGKDVRYHADYRIRASAGNFRWFRDVGGITGRHPDGSPAKVTGIVIDITTSRQAAAALRTSEERYRLLADNINDVLWVLNLETGKWTYMSPSVERLRGYTVEEVFTQSVQDVMTPASFAYSQKVMPERVERFLQDESGLNSYLDEIEQTCRDGSTVWTEVANRYIRNEQGELTLLGLTRDISTRKEAARALEESETRFRSLIQNSSDIIRILGSDGRILYESPSSERILGYPPGSLIGMDPMEFVHPDDVGRVKNDFGEVIDRKNPGIPTEFRIRKADGEYLWVDSIGTNLLDVPGVNGVVITTRPIQQRKMAEEQISMTIAQLERSEALLRNVYDILPIGLWLADKTGKLIYGNPAGVKIWGAEPLVPIEEYGVFKARRYPSGEEIAGDDWALAHSIREGVTIKDELLEIDAFDGKKKVIVNYTAPLFDAAGAIDGAIVVNQEITDKIKAEEALRDNQARLATAMDIAGLVNWEYDVRSGMFTFDDRFYALYETTAGREGGNLMSAETYLREFVYPEDRQNVVSGIEKLLATTDPDYAGQLEHRITPRDGSVRTIIARFAPVMGPDGTVIRTYGANQDITDSKLMESEIRSLNTVLEQRIKDRTEALSTANEKLKEENAQRIEAEGKLQASFDEKVMLLKEIHHRVKNNLQIIASLLNLQSRYISDPQTLAAIRESQNRVKAMALVHEKLYRSEDISHISLHDYIRFLGTGLFQFYDAKIRGIQFMLEIAEVNVDIDSAIPLGLILNELISNSLKYAFPEGRKGAVSISVKKEEHTITVLYQDNGIGIPADLDWRDTPSLGLRLVNTLVDQMNGTVELDRSAGTLFTMVLHEKEHREEK